MNQISAVEKRKNLLNQLSMGRCLMFPGAISPLSARLIENIKFDGVYISGAMIANDLGYPDTGLTSLTEVVQRAANICLQTNLPCIVDSDTGFGNQDNCKRAIELFEAAGLAGCHIEDQVFPKKCGHLDHKELISKYDMGLKIKAAHSAQTDPNFLLIARCDARANEGIDGLIERANYYYSHGAKMIFVEALETLAEYQYVRKNVNGYLLANCTEFGKTPIFNFSELASIGYNIVIYPLTLQRLAMKSIEKGLQILKNDGHQAELIDQMQTRQELYDLLDYEP